MITECTDCGRCASFIDGFRIYCVSSKFPADEVFKYQPLGERNAENCPDLEYYRAMEFSSNDLDEMQESLKPLFENSTEEQLYKAIHDWCEKNKDRAI